MGEQLVPVRKERAGSDSYGHVWAEDGAVVEVPYTKAMELLRIPDGGFTVAEAITDQQQDPGDDGQGEDDGDGEEVTEPAPGAEAKVTEPAPAKPAATGRRTTRKTTAAK